MNSVLEMIHQVIGTLVSTFNLFTQAYIDKDDSWIGFLAVAAFAIVSKTNRQKFYIPGQLIFGRDMIISIKNTVDGEMIRHQKQIQIIKYDIHKNRHIFEYDYKVGDDAMFTNHTVYKH